MRRFSSRLETRDVTVGSCVIDSTCSAPPWTRRTMPLDSSVIRSLRIVSVDVPALGGVMNDSARAALNSWLLDYAREEPVYRLDDSTFGRIASRRIDRVDIDSGLITLRMD